MRRRSARDPRRSGKAESSRRGSNSNTETTDSWDKMSDADSARVYEEGAEEGGEGEVDQEKVQELERTVNKRYVYCSYLLRISMMIECKLKK